jgi:hypothetical protein
MSDKRVRPCEKKAAKFENQTNSSVWETLAQRRKIARICALFQAYTDERTWKAIGDSFCTGHPVALFN